MQDDSSTSQIADSVRIRLLDAEVAEWIREDWRVESRSNFQAVMVSGRRVNHLLHLVLALVTAGLWIFVWIALVLTGGENRELLLVDIYGLISSEEV
ncbi:MAG: hypothetical protein OXC99_07165 [Chloroflexi bacterium]|nr:hypothetical protein [Chloroflexota bacterium]